MIKHGFVFVFLILKVSIAIQLFVSLGEKGYRYVIKLLTVFSLRVEFGVSFQIQ